MRLDRWKVWSHSDIPLLCRRHIRCLKFGSKLLGPYPSEWSCMHAMSGGFPNTTRYPREMVAELPSLSKSWGPLRSKLKIGDVGMQPPNVGWFLPDLCPHHSIRISYMHKLIWLVSTSGNNAKCTSWWKQDVPYDDQLPLILTYGSVHVSLRGTQWTSYFVYSWLADSLGLWSPLQIAPSKK